MLIYFIIICRKTPIIFLLLFLSLFLGGCNKTAQKTVKTSLIYRQTLLLFDASNPGYGLDTSVKEQKLHHPMAYALFASAESQRYLKTKDSIALNNALIATNWLIKNKNLSGSKEVGWGLPFAWDAFRDGSINPPDTTYTITTALVIQALLDVYIATLESPVAIKEADIRPLLLNTAISAAETFTKERFSEANSDELVFWYSVRPEDSYHVLNVSSMLVGQLQRLSRYAPLEKARKFSNLADQGVTYIMKRVQIDRKGNIFWLYAGDYWSKSSSNRPNDLVHESYVIQGLIDYVIHGGDKANLVNPKLLYKSFNRFITDERIYEFPRGYKPPKKVSGNWDRAARLWGVGYAIYVTSRIEYAFHLQPVLITKFLCVGLKNYWDGKKLYYQTDKNDKNIYPRQSSHLLLGLAFVAREEYNCNFN